MTIFILEVLFAAALESYRSNPSKEGKEAVSQVFSALFAVRGC